MKIEPSTPTLSIAATSSSPVAWGGQLGTLCQGRFGVFASYAWTCESMIMRDLLAEGKREGLDARIEELDLELAIGNRARLTDELVETLRGHAAVALRVGVGSMCCLGRLAIDQHAEANRGSRPGRSHDQIYVPRVKAVHDAPVCFLQDDGVAPRRPVSGGRPLVEAQASGCGVHAAVRLVIAEVGFRGLEARPIRRDLKAGAVRGSEIARHAGGARLGEELLDHSFRGFVFAFPKMAVAHAALAVEEVDGGPGVVRERAP